MSDRAYTTIYIDNLPTNSSFSGITSAIDKDFLKELFQDYNIANTPDSVIIKTRVDEFNNPTSYAFIKLENSESAIRAISELNYTKLDGIPIRIMLADNETKEIIRSRVGCLIIKNLDKSIEVSQLHDAFANFGEIIECKIFKNMRDSNTAYVQFRRQEDANQAKSDLQEASINGRPVEISLYDRQEYEKIVQSSQPSSNTNKIYIKNFPKYYDDNDLKYLVSRYGKVESVNILQDEYGISKQVGFAEMKSNSDALKAAQHLNGLRIEGSEIHCHIMMDKSAMRYEYTKQSQRSSRIFYHDKKRRFLYVRNFKGQINDQQLNDVFSQFGKIEYAHFNEDKLFGFVLFYTNEEALNCIRNSPLLFHGGRQLYVTYAMSREDRSNELHKRMTLRGQSDDNPMSILRSKISEKYPNNRTLLQRCRDMSKLQAEMLVNNVYLFDQWAEYK